MTKISVVVMFKPNVLDPLGKFIQKSLQNFGFGGINNVRTGKIIQMEIDGDRDTAKSQAEQMGRQFLANSITEDFKVIE